jgi:hypothetical protein
MRNLLITTIGKYNHLNVWLAGECNFDVAIVNYDNHNESQDLVLKCIWYDTFSTFKYPGIWNLLRDEPRLLRYDFFWMPDEDIMLATEKINELFDKMKAFNLDLAQPSIEKSNTSFPSWECFTHKENASIIYTNFIEITCPCFSKNALDKCLQTFKKSQSGWGLDLVWEKLIGDNNINIAIINDIVAKHTRNVGGGELYNVLKRDGIRPSNERKKLMAEYGILAIDIKIHD